MENNKEYYISFIVPICNNSVLFQTVVSAILNQTKGNVEIVVVDGSKKEYLEVNKQHITLFNETRIKYIVKKDNKGFKGATETGIKKATGRFVVLLYNKEQWNEDEEKNGFLDKFVTKIKGE